MKTDYDVIVAGLGAMGSSAAFHLATQNKHVLGLDRFHPPHNLGSSHGFTRIIREAYFEHPSYVPLVQRAYELWSNLEKQSGRQLFLKTGGLMIGPSDGVLVSGAKRSALEHHLPHQVLSSKEMQLRFPILHPSPEMVGVWEPRAGILFPESAIQAHLELASDHGAELIFNDPVLNWEARAGGVTVHTATRSFTAHRLLLSAGAWLGSLVTELKLPLQIERQVLFWFEPGSQVEQFHPRNCPIHLWEYEPRKFFYGFPDLGDGIKVAVHHQGEKSEADNIRRDVTDQEAEAMRHLLRHFLPAADGRLKSAAVCIYTNTPDEHFILDYHPVHHQVLIASPCSGHGFKFSSVVGEIAAELLDDKQPRFDLSLFKISRFASKDHSKTRAGSPSS